MTKKTFSPFEPDVETKAFLYQQVVDVQRVLQGQGSLAILCEKQEQTSGGDLYAVTFTTPEVLNFTSRAEGDSLIEASIKAKEAFMSKLHLIINEMSVDQRPTSVQYLH